MDSLQTGDVLLFQDTSGWWFSSLVQWFTGSIYSHVAVVLKNPVYINPDLNTMCMLESGTEEFPDQENKKVKFGVQITNLAEKIATYPGHIWVRKLNTEIPMSTIEREVALLHSTVHDKPYDWNPYDLLNTILKFKDANDQRTDSFFCSALTAYVYTKLGLFKEGELWDLDTPKFFGGPDVNGRMVNGSLSELLVQLK